MTVQAIRGSASNWAAGAVLALIMLVLSTVIVRAFDSPARQDERVGKVEQRVSAIEASQSAQYTEIAHRLQSIDEQLRDLRQNRPAGAGGNAAK